MFGKSKKVEEFPFKFELGQRVKDSITGFEGIITNRTQWISNCNTYGVSSTKLKDGKPLDSIGFDEPMLVLVDEKPIVKAQRSTGGPCETVKETNRL